MFFMLMFDCLHVLDGANQSFQLDVLAQLDRGT